MAARVIARGRHAVLDVPKTTPGLAGGKIIALADRKTTKRIPQ